MGKALGASKENESKTNSELEKFDGEERHGVLDPNTYPLGNTCSADAPLYGGCGEETLEIGPLVAIFHMYIVLHRCRYTIRPRK